MDNKIYELEEYIALLNSQLKLDSDLKTSICKEIYQDLYSKFNEFLIKGYSVDASISYTLEAFEDPIKLAKMFNHTYKENIYLDNAIGFIYDRKAILIAIVASMLMAFII